MGFEQLVARFEPDGRQPVDAQAAHKRADAAVRAAGLAEVAVDIRSPSGTFIIDATKRLSIPVPVLEPWELP
jgi:hypothetical protein